MYPTLHDGIINLALLLAGCILIGIGAGSWLVGGGCLLLVFGFNGTMYDRLKKLYLDLVNSVTPKG